MVERQYEILKRERMRAAMEQQQQTQQAGLNQAPAAAGPTSVGAQATQAEPQNAPPTGSVTEMKAPEKAEEPENIGSDPAQPAATSAPAEIEKADEPPSEVSIFKFFVRKARKMLEIDSHMTPFIEKEIR